MKLVGSIQTLVFLIENKTFRRQVDEHGKIKWKRYEAGRSAYGPVTGEQKCKLERAFKDKIGAA